MTSPLPPVPTGRQRCLRARFVVATPMFIGDANQQTTSIRPPAIKGALRFWWRALQWPRLYQEEGDKAMALKRLHQEEAELFGLAAGQEGDEGQARVTLRVESQDIDIHLPSVSPSVRYLFGPGWNKQHKAVKENSQFTLALVGRPGKRQPTDAQWASLEEALMAFGLLGGLGARARKGLGSVSLQALDGGTHAAPQTAEEYRRALQVLLAELPLKNGKLPPFTAFSGVSRLDVSLPPDTAEEVLIELGKQLQLYRSYGRKGMVNDNSAEQNFSDDHDSMLRVAQGDVPRHPPRRMVFGLPHNYFFSSSKANLQVTSAKGERRASPLFMHVHRLPDGGCLGVQLLMPAVFLPAENNELSFRSRKHPQAEWKKDNLMLNPNDIKWVLLHKFLDRFDERETLMTPQTNQPSEVQA